MAGNGTCFCKLKNNSIIGYIIRVDIFRRVVNKISNHLRKTNENLIQDCWKLILKLIIIKKYQNGHEIAKRNGVLIQQSVALCMLSL